MSATLPVLTADRVAVPVDPLSLSLRELLAELAVTEHSLGDALTRFESGRSDDIDELLQLFIRERAISRQLVAVRSHPPASAG